MGDKGDVGEPRYMFHVLCDSGWLWGVKGGKGYVGDMKDIICDFLELLGMTALRTMGLLEKKEGKVKFYSESNWQDSN